MVDTKMGLFQRAKQLHASLATVDPPVQEITLPLRSEKLQRAFHKSLPYAGVIVLGAVLPLIRSGNSNMLSLLCDELIIVYGYIVSVHDLKTRQAPNSIIAAMLATWIIVMIPQLLVNPEKSAALLLDAALGCAIGGGLFLLVYVVSRRGLGGGDVKFMAVTGLYLGFGMILPAMLIGTLIAGITGITLILLKKLNRKDAMPLIPFLYIGILYAVWFQ